jgi:serine/threonine protein kinase
VKLADFGLAKIVKADGLKTFCGTPAYFAPEVLERRGTVAGEGRYGKPADCWSLGVILYILLTGRPPFDADMDQPKELELDFDSDPLWASLPLAQELVQQMLRQDPKRRLTVGQACDHPWINIDDGDTHSHPLDDPAVTTKKRLFATERNPTDDWSTPSRRPHDNDASSLCSLDDSVRSRDDSVLSKEEFAHAAVSHIRNDSVFHFDATMLLNADLARHTKQSINVEEDRGVRAPWEGVKASVESTNQIKATELDVMDVETSIPSSPRIDEGHNSPCPDVMNPVLSIGSNRHPAGEGSEDLDDNIGKDGISPTASRNEDVRAPNMVSDSTPNDNALSPPRSPLARLNLNERCNRFRNEVLQQNGANMNSPSMEPTEPAEGVKNTCQTAVTPTSSNVSKQEQQRDVQNAIGIDQSPNAEDPILSQFSSEPSSVDSFGDSSMSSSNGVRKGSGTRKIGSSPSTLPKIERGENKRMLEHDAISTDDSSKRARLGKEVKQTTLTSWFVKKQA